MKKYLKYIILALLVAWTFATPRTPAGVSSLSAEPHYPRIVRAVTRMMPVLHLYRMPVDEASLTERTIDEYLTSLDFDRAYFLKSDIERFRAKGDNLLDEMRKGDVQWAYDVFDTFKERVNERIDWVEILLGKGFDFDRDEHYAWKRRQAAWPQDKAERDELWRRKIKHEVLGRMVAERTRESDDQTNDNDNDDNDDNDNHNDDDDKDKYTRDPGNGGDADAEHDKTDAEADANAEADVDAEDTGEVVDLDTTPEEFILNRYEQYRIVLQDHEPEWVLQKFLSAFSHAFDPHSDYMSASADEDFDINMSLSLEGIGAQLTSEDGAAKIVNIIPGGPAERDGRLQPGDKIIAVGQEGDKKPESVLHWSLTRTVRRIRGPKGSKVTLLVIPATDKTGSTTVTIELTRDEVRLEEQAASGDILDFEIEPEKTRRLGVITLPTFYLDVRGRRNNVTDYRSSTRDVRNHVVNMIEENVEGLVLDLRANGGGSLTEAVEMTGLFLNAGPIVQVKERRGVQVLRDQDPKAIYDGPLVILVSRLSASASEILAAALQDYGRAVIVGDSKTHGKGTVQTVLPLDRSDPRMGSLKVTAASFHRVNGQSTQKHGVSSDITIPSMLETMEVGEEYLRNPIPWSRVDPVPFKWFADLSDEIPVLRERSTERIEGCESWQSRMELLERVRAVREADTISLNLEERLRMSEKERDLRRNELRRQTTNNDNDLDLERDAVLREALYVLADWINVR